MNISRQLLITLLAITFAKVAATEDVVLKFCLNRTELIAKAEREEVEDGYRFNIKEQVMFKWVGIDFEQTSVNALHASIVEILANDPSDEREFTRNYLIAVTEFIPAFDLKMMASGKWTDFLLPRKTQTLENNILTIEATKHITNCSISFLEARGITHVSRRLTNYAYMLTPKLEYSDGFPKVGETFGGKEILLLKMGQLGTQFLEIKNGIMTADGEGKTGPIAVFISPGIKFKLNSIYWRKIISPRVIYSDHNWIAIEFMISPKPKGLIKFTRKDNGNEIEVEGEVIQHEYKDQLCIQQADIFRKINGNNEDTVIVEPSDFTVRMQIQIYVPPENDEEVNKVGEKRKRGEKEEDFDSSESGGEEDSDCRESGGEEDSDRSESGREEDSGEEDGKMSRDESGLEEEEVGEVVVHEPQKNWSTYTISAMLSVSTWPVILALE